MNRLRFALALLVVLALVGLANAAIATSLISSFGLSGAAIKPAWILPFSLTALFVAMMFISQKFFSPLTRTLYFVGAIWMGLFVYWLMVSFIHALLVLAGGPEWISEALFCLSFVAVAYGTLHERRIAVKKLTVQLISLPVQWQGRTVVFLSDLHLGQIHSARFATRVAAIVNSLNADIVLIGGDYFDGSPVVAQENAAAFRHVRSTFGTFYVTGNHEEFGDSSIFVKALTEAGVTVINDDKREIEGLQLVGVGYGAAEKRDDFDALLGKLNIDSARPSILIKHEPRDVDIAAKWGISLQLSGHTHRAQMWPLSYIPRLIYKGFDYGLKRIGRTQVYTSSGVGTWGPPVRVGTDSEIVVITLE